GAVGAATRRVRTAARVGVATRVGGRGASGGRGAAATSRLDPAAAHAARILDRGALRRAAAIDVAARWRAKQPLFAVAVAVRGEVAALAFAWPRAPDRRESQQAQAETERYECAPRSAEHRGARVLPAPEPACPPPHDGSRRAEAQPLRSALDSTAAAKRRT